MRTTIDLPEELFRAAKTRAAQQGTTLKKLMTQFIRTGLDEENVPPLEPRKRARPPVAIAQHTRQVHTPALTNRQLHELLEAEDLSHHYHSQSDQG
jgi:hypothetical protein